MDAKTIEASLIDCDLGRSVLCFDEVNSTNNVAADAISQGNAHGLIVLAEQQRAGRGRFGRSWVSPPGKNILMSIVLSENGIAEAAGVITLAAGLAVAEAIAEGTRLSPRLKWPNDVWLMRRKLAGVLIERKGDALIVGMGVNVLAAPPDAAVDRPATCLAEHLDAPPNREQLVALICRRLAAWTAPPVQSKISDLHDAWCGRCGMLHDRVEITSGEKTFTGHVLDVHPVEGLHLVEDTGQHVFIPAAGASLQVLSTHH